MDLILQYEYSESDFIAACVRGERWAQKKLYEDHYTPLMAVCMRYANDDNDALDILHEGFIKVFKNIHKYQIDSSLSAWLKRIFINTSIDYYRKEQRRKEDNIDTALHLTSHDADVVSNMSSEEILKALQQLSTSYRSVFNLYVLEGYSHREISEMLNITESTCRSNLVKARTKLKTILLAIDRNIR